MNRQSEIDDFSTYSPHEEHDIDVERPFDPSGDRGSNGTDRFQKTIKEQGMNDPTNFLTASLSTPEHDHQGELALHLIHDHGFDRGEINPNTPENMKSHVHDHMGINQEEYGPSLEGLHEHEEMKHASRCDPCRGTGEYKGGSCPHCGGEGHQEVDDRPEWDENDPDDKWYSSYLQEKHFSKIALFDGDSPQLDDQGGEDFQAPNIPRGTKTPGSHGLHEEQQQNPQYMMGQDLFMLGQRYRFADIEHMSEEGIGAFAPGVGPEDAIENRTDDVQAHPDGMTPDTYHDQGQTRRNPTGGPLGISGWFDSQSGSGL